MVRRIEWLDAARGIGMIAVVAGHILVGPPQGSLYLFHMPLFFLLSGYVIRPKDTPATTAKRRASQLLLPYLCWLILIGLPSIIGSLRSHDLSRLGDLAFGGSRLAGPLGVFWFPTALWAAIVLYAAVDRLPGKGPLIAAAIAYGLAVLRGLLLPNLEVPLAFDAALFIVPFLKLGTLSRTHEWAERKLVLVGLAAIYIVAAVGVLAKLIPLDQVLDVKRARYGIPILSPVIALGGSAMAILLAKYSGPLQAPLAHLGRISLLVMFVHQVIQLRVDAVGLHHPIARIVVAIAIPIALYPILHKVAILRRLLLGEVAPKPVPQAS